VKSKTMIIAGAGAVVLLAVSYFFLLPMIKGGSAEAESHAAADLEHDEEEAPAKPKKKKKAAEPGLIFPMQERVLNLSSQGGVPRYARIELALEFEKPEKAAAPAKKSSGGHGAEAKDAAHALDPALDPVVARKVLIDDAIVRIVGTKTVEMMTSAEGKEALKQEILAAVEEIVYEPAITGVYIVQLVVQ
jgi:flagellar basal body-associated protein FliL